MRLLLIRHGETLINVKGLTHYTNDVVSLNPKGREQAKLLIPVCKKNNIEIIYTSPEARSIDTTNAITSALQIPGKILDDFHERQWGKWEGQPWDKIEKVLNTMPLRERYIFVPPGGESWEQMELRIRHGLDYILEQEHKSAAIVTHGGVLRALIPLLRQTSISGSLGYQFKNASVTIFETEVGEEKIFREILTNDTSHLK